MHVAALFIHPVKSLRGIPVESAELDARGLLHDRRWMVVDEGGGFLTQRQHPRMVLIRPTVVDGRLELAADGFPAMEVPHPPADAARMRVRVWKDECEALRAHAAADAWLSAVLGVRCHLVFMPDDARRRMSGAELGVDAPQVSFTDGYPLHLLGEGSLRELNRRLTSPVGVERFRPNLLVAGAEPHAEDGWTGVEVGGVRLRTVAPCERCVITTVRPEDGTREREPLRTLASYRNTGGSVTFGTYLAHESRGTIRVGDPVRLV